MDVNPILILIILAFTGFVAYFLVTNIVGSVIEPIYIRIYNRPVYLYFYPILKKIPDRQKRILEDNVPFYRRQTDRKKKYFEHRIADFLANYEFFGKDGLIITDEIRIMVSAAYVTLTFGFRDFKIGVFDKIIIYPDTYHSTLKHEDHNGEFNPLYKAIVFSWKHFKEGYEEGNDNLNLGIHEFAHALHYYGLRKVDNGAVIFADEYEKIQREINYPPNRVKLINSSYFRIYAYTNQYEFIAVILEHFFETPEQFRQEFPQLFDHVRIMINYNET